LRIAEVISRFEDVKQFVNVLQTLGFRVKRRDDSNKMFILFDCVKTSDSCPKAVQEASKSQLMKACIYKRR
jgi:ribosomal RNA-processing protein 8